MNRLEGLPVTIRPVALDVGMVQADSVRVDVAATEKRVADLLTTWDQKVAEEAAWMGSANLSGVVSDIPGIAIEAAAACGVRTVALGNFGWDWIYEDFVKEGRVSVWSDAVTRYRKAYAKTDVLLRLPFSEPMKAFPNQVSVPLVVHPGVARRTDIAERTGADPEDFWVLLSFTTLDWSSAARAKVSAIPGVRWFTIEPLGWDEPRFHTVKRSDLSVPDLFATVDAVLTKPGFGVLSDCTINSKPIIHVEREDFREYPILRKAVEDHLASVFLPAASLYAGDLSEAIAEVMQVEPAPDPVEADSGAEAARLLFDALEI